MHKQELKHRILNKINLHELLKHFTAIEVALIFKVPHEYVNKCERLQRIIVGEITAEDEMKIGRRGAWMLSVERKYIKQFDNKDLK